MRSFMGLLTFMAGLGVVALPAVAIAWGLGEAGLIDLGCMRGYPIYQLR